MEQIVQNFRSKKLELIDVPFPILQDGQVLVQNLYSAISLGTEISTIKKGEQSLIKTAKQRPDLVKQVYTNYKKFGLVNTYQKVTSKLDELKSLGYSCCGIVLESKSKFKHFKVGDLVACAGQDFANHAQIVSVPERLVIPVNNNICPKQASFVALGSIALQGLRLAECGLGETIVVLGLGIIGQLTCILAKANGLKVIALDINDEKLALAKKIGADYTFNNNINNLDEIINQITQNNGVDSCIITASTSSSEPINFCSQVVRKKGSIIVVGAVGLNIQRDPHFYRKEIRLQISCSYGPGRYDEQYEKFGIDYPYAYVRWTQERNMQAFIDLLASNKIDLSEIITHEFPIGEAIQAYNKLKEAKELTMGAIFSFPHKEEKINNNDDINQNSHDKIRPIDLSKINKIAVIGAGNFAKGHIFPIISKLKNNNLVFDTVVTQTGSKSLNVQRKYNIKNISTKPDQVLANPDIPIIFIINTHNFHSSMALEAVNNKKYVFLEKPLVISLDELNSWKKHYNDTILNNRPTYLFMGFNRRYAPLTVEIQKVLKNCPGPKIVRYRILAGKLDNQHWLKNPQIGGGRILGEFCHFIDLIFYLFNQDVVNFQVLSITPSHKACLETEDLSLQIQLKDDTIIQLVYTQYSTKNICKETLEIFHYETSIICEDFRTLSVHSNGKTRKTTSTSKGYKEEIDQFFESFLKDPMPQKYLKEYINVHDFLFKIFEQMNKNNEIN